MLRRGALILLSISLLAQAPAQDVVRFGIIPSIAHERMESEFRPIADFLGKKNEMNILIWQEPNSND